MKKTTLLLLLWAITVPQLLAQMTTAEKNLEVPANKKVELNLKFANAITITSWDQNRVSVQVNYHINNGRLNDALVLTAESDPTSARIVMGLDEEILNRGNREDCPEGQEGNQYFVKGNATFTCGEFHYEVFVPRDADLKVETINGNIEIRELTGPVEAKSISGFVDMDWSPAMGAEVMLKTITGEVFSDLDLVLAGRKKNPMVGYQLKGSLNNGGSTIKLNSISNNIYLRAKE